MTKVFARIRGLSGTLGPFNERLFYAYTITVSESPGVVYPDPQMVVCDRSEELYRNKTLIFSKDIVLLEYNADEPINTRRYYIIEVLSDKILGKIVDCSGIRAGLFQARIYLFSESHGVAYPTHKVVVCTPSFEIDGNTLSDGDFVVLQGKIRGSHYIITHYNYIITHYIIKTFYM